MQKLARKTLLSIFAVAITIIAIGAITFAWFTMTTIADVDSFDTDIRAESGIEISLDCQSFASYIRKDAIVNQIKNNLLIEEGPIVLNPVTTANGFSNFRTISQYNGTPILEEVGEDGAKWIWFNLYFRTPEKSTYVYLLDDTEISSDGRPWKADVTFNDTATHVVHTGETKMIYAANALRMSFLTCDMDLSKIDAGEEPIGNEPKSVVIYELDPTYGTPPQPNEMNNRLDQTIKQGYGLIEYFRIKNEGSIDDPDSGINLADYFDNGVLPQNVLNNENLVSAAKLNETRSVIEGEKAAILSFDEENYHEDTGYYYGAVKVQMWIEGWDPDSYNAIHMADLQIKLSFGGTKQRPSIDSTLIDPTKEYDIEYIWEPGYGIPQNPNPATIKAYELPMFLKPAALEGYVFDGWYLTYEAGGPGEQGAYSDRVNYLPRDFAPESGEGIKLYGKLREFNINYDLLHEFNEAAELDELLTPKSYVGKDLDQLSIALPVPGTYTTGSGDMEIIYNFLGWYLNPEYMGNPVTVINNLINAVPGDITLYAKWEAEYKITYDFNEHEGADNPNPATVKTSELPLSLQPASLYGYAFLGWYLDSDFSGDPVTALPVGMTENVTLYGRFGNYAIDYDLGIAEGIAALPGGMPTGYNIEMLPLEIPAVANLVIGTGDDMISYSFEGWYLHPDFSGPEITEIDDAMPFGNLTLYAKWDAEIKINYDYGTREGVVNPNPETLLISERPFTLEEASLPGYKFLGWYLRSDFSGPKITKIDHTFPVESITLYAKFGAEIYTITYDLGIASGIVTLPDESPADYSAEVFPLDLPVLDEFVIGAGEDAVKYSFAGWYLNPEFTGSAVTALDGTHPFGNLTLHAKWDAVEEYAISYDFGGLEGVDNPNPTNVTIAELPLALQPATFAGYKFLGWYLTADYSGDSVSSVSKGITEDLILYGKFGDYEINYDLGVGAGTVTLPDGFPEGYNAATLPIALPDLEDFIEGEAEEAVRYAFAGWYTDPDFSGSAITAIDEGIPFADLTLYAKWDIVEEYAISYDFGGLESVDNPNPETIAISDLPFELLPATLAGYEFVGWYLDPDYSGEPVTSIPAGLTEGMALYGKFEVAP